MQKNWDPFALLLVIQNDGVADVENGKALSQKTKTRITMSPHNSTFGYTSKN